MVYTAPVASVLRRLRRRLRRFFRRAIGRLVRPVFSRQMARAADARLLGLHFFTDPQVLHPVFFRSTRVLVRALSRFDLARKRVLDMGSGSGAIGVFAAAGGARVTACDINPRAVALTRRNLQRHGLDGDVLESDLFAAPALHGRAFDLICFNIPFYAGEPRTPFEAALFGGNELETVRDFAAGCAARLVEGGAVLIVFSEDADRDQILSLFTKVELDLVEERTAQSWFEKFHVVTFWRAILPDGP